MTYLRRLTGHVNTNGLWVPGLALATVGYYVALQPLLTATNAAAQRVWPDAFSFTQRVFRPEPLELPAYFAGFLLIPLLAAGLAYAAAWGLERAVLTERFVRGWPAGLLLIALGYVGFGAVVHVGWFDAWRQLPVRGDLKLQAMVMGGLILAGLLAWRSFDFATVVRRLEQLPWRAVRVGLFGLLAVLVISPDFPFDHHHYHDQLGPVNDLLHGKHLLQDTTTHYGLLNTYFWYGLFRFVTPLSYQATSLVLMLTLWGWLVGWYYLVRAWLRSEALAAVATLAIAAAITIPMASFDVIYRAPSGSPFHQLFVLVLAWLVWHYDRTGGGWRERAWLLGGAAVSFFWFTDTGLYLPLCVLAVLAAESWVRRAPLRRRLAGVGANALVLTLAIAALAGAFSLGQYLQTGAWPDWLRLYASLAVYRAGYMLGPLPPWGWYYLYVMVLAGSLLYMLLRAHTQRSIAGLALPLFLTLFGILQLTYYMTRSFPTNLASRSVFILVLLAAWWWTVLSQHPREWSTSYRAASALAAGALAALLLAGLYQFGRTVRLRDYRHVVANFTSEHLRRPEVYDGSTAILDDLAVLRRDYADLVRPAIVHWHDAALLIRLGKTNALSIFNFPAVLTRSEMDAVIAQVRRHPPRELFIGRPGAPGFGPFADYADKLEYFRAGVQDRYVLDRALTTMDVYRRSDSPPREEGNEGRSADASTPTTADPLLTSPPRGGETS